jgi:hypothetical protein
MAIGDDKRSYASIGARCSVTPTPGYGRRLWRCATTMGRRADVWLTTHREQNRSNRLTDDGMLASEIPQVTWSAEVPSVS